MAGLGLAGMVVSVVSTRVWLSKPLAPSRAPFRWLVRSGRRGRHRPAHLGDL